MLLKSSKASRSAFSLLEISAVILIIGILVAGVMGGNILIAKSRLAAAVTLTNSSPISGIKDSALWLETSVDSSFAENETTNDNSLSTWYDARKGAANKVTITAAGSGPVYSNTINYIHAVKFEGSSSNHLQIADASFLNNTDYTIVILEKRQSNSANNYFFGESPTGTANQKLALGYSLDGAVIHAQGTNSYTSNVSSYANSTDKPKIFTFVSDSSNGKKTYINGILAAESSDTTQLSGLTTNFPIGKSYTGEIGEIAIFTRPLKAEERKSVEDYMAKKFSMKLNRDSVANGSCTTGTITPSGCSMDCSTASRAGISTPSTITDGQTTNATCGQTGYSGSLVSLTCTSGSLSGSACGCNTGAGYSMSGGVCVQNCSVSVSGSSTTSVASGATQVTCDAGGNYATTPFTFSACSGSTITGSCSCATGYTGASCNTCDTANNYVPSGGNCVPGCPVTASNGVTSPTTVVVGTSSLTCNDNANGFSGSMNYTCASGGVFTINTPCTLACTGGVRTVSGNGKTIHTFTSGTGNFNCPEAKTVNVLVVGGGGGGGGVGHGWAGGGGGAGGLIYQTNYSISASTNYPVTVGSSVAFTTQGNPSSFGSLTALGGGMGVNYSASGGGSGSGAANTSATLNGGLGTPGQGNNGGKAYLPSVSNSVTSFSGGGGGACGAGKNAVAGLGGDGGDGCPIDIDGDGTSVYYAGGGGGGNHPNNAGARTDNGLAGLGGGSGRNTASANATPNTGGGGEVYGGGASGVVIVAY